MQKQERKNRKKLAAKEQQPVEKEEASKQVFSHQMMQMQSLYGNKAVERTMHAYSKQMAQTSNEQRTAIPSEAPTFIPIRRWWNKDDISGMRMYVTKKFFREEPRREHSREEEKPQKSGAKKGEEEAGNLLSQSTLSQQESEEEERAVFPSSKRKADAHHKLVPSFQARDEKKDEHAKKYFTSSNTDNQFEEASDRKGHDSTIEDDIFHKKIEKIIKYGRFSFIGAYPLVLLALKRRKKKGEERKKSTLPRLTRRFSRTL